MNSRILSLLLAIILFSGCSIVDFGNSEEEVWAEPESLQPLLEDQARVLAYQCETSGLRFTAAEKTDALYLFLDDQGARLTPVMGEEGYQWEKGEVRFEIFSETHVGVTLKGKEHVCEVDRYQTLWEAAKLSGVNYRGVGHEPEWILEVSEGLSFARILSPLSRLSLSGPIKIEPVEDTPVSILTFTRYPDVSIELSGYRCQDTMDDRVYDSSIEIRMDGQVYRGCGRALH